ncbi:serine/threonine protein kinase [Desulfopila sp. IMCC35008]|uniref:serine/threonine protein kinase n=1 Tax=Desulfopila sp. IMCC35008 TaxID=2653858 RepID=UPI0013D09602|nr:serine/threonine protein kinase [Desulfopila sp. IMCC35008]
MVDWSRFPEHILPRLKKHPAVRSMRRHPRLYSDTSDFVNIDYGDIIHVDNRYFLVVGYTREGRFGVDEQPKQWVPKVYDLVNGERLIVKLVFHEQYSIRLGGLEVTCYRSPEKEAQVIELTRGDRSFMQGYSALDEADNLVRILEIVNGRRLDKVVYGLGDNHRDYFENHLAGVLTRFLCSVEGIGKLHANGLKHGDIRRDHIYVDRKDGHFCWIDFDYDFYLPERPYAMDLFGLGNVLLFLIGQGAFRPRAVLENPHFGEKVFTSLTENDLALIAKDRIFNIKKLYPYIPDSLNDILLHFSTGTEVLYDTVEEFYSDLATAVDTGW